MKYQASQTEKEWNGEQDAPRTRTLEACATSN